MPDPTQMPDPTADSRSQGKPAESSPGDPAEQAEKREQAGGDLVEAGERIAKAGEELGEASAGGSSEPPEFPQDPTSQPGGGEWDPLMPDSENPSASESDVFADAEDAASDSSADPASAEASAGGSPASGGEMADASDDMMESGAPSGGGEMADASDDMMEPGAPSGGGSLSDEIQAAQEALQEAGIALQTAGDTLQTAQSPADIAAAEELLSDARIAVIVAGQDLMEAREIYEGEPGMEEIFTEAEDALNEANMVIVIATQTLSDAAIEFPGGTVAGGRVGELEQELEESLVVFEGQILDARRTIIDTTPPPEESGSGTVFGAPTGGTPGEAEEAPDLIQGEVEIVQQGRMPGDEETVATAPSQPTNIPDDIPDPQGDDIVAQQLREAAIAESDPELQEKLWEEYKRYKAGL